MIDSGGAGANDVPDGKLAEIGNERKKKGASRATEEKVNRAKGTRKQRG